MDWQLTSLPFPGTLLGLIDFIGTNMYTNTLLGKFLNLEFLLQLKARKKKYC